MSRPFAPIIVTALMGDQDFAWADALRRSHFPPERNLVPAHISLFHHLPPARLAELTRLIDVLVRSPPPAAHLTGVMHLGRGVAYRVESPALLALRARIADHFARDLIPQDQPAPRLHITIQNKASAAESKALHVRLTGEFRERPIRIAGLAAWHYLDGPWSLAHSARFRG